MHYQPRREDALRHLFSSRLGEDTLKMCYLGPVLDQSGNVQDSPDGLILDKREKRWRKRKCEFKLAPCSKSVFADNGQFDIAIVWSIKSPATKDSLERDLAEQNGCCEVIVMQDYPVFVCLPQYDVRALTDLDLEGVADVERVLMRVVRSENAYATAYAAYIAAAIYPLKFDLASMVNTLDRRFPEVHQMSPKGRANVVTKLRMTKPPLIIRKAKWRWTEDINASAALDRIGQIIRVEFGKEVPDKAIIDEFRTAKQY